jgi:hypothetical protein
MQFFQCKFYIILHGDFEKIGLQIQVLWIQQG